MKKWVFEVQVLYHEVVEAETREEARIKLIDTGKYPPNASISEGTRCK